MHVLVISDDRSAAEAIGNAIRFAPPLRALGYIGTASAGMTFVERANADIVVIDEPSPAVDLTVLVRMVRAAAPDAKLLLLTDDLGDARLSSATNAGLDAAIARSAPPPSIGLLIREVAAGRVYHRLRRRAAELDTHAAGLTSRELQILKLVAAGLSNARIAELLFVTEQTVKFHLSNVYRKLGIANRTQASHYAHMNGLLDTDVVEDRSLNVALAA